MKQVLVAYYSRTGKTEKMADYIAEGVRMAGHTAEVLKISEIKSEKDLQAYDGLMLGCPTYHRDMTENMKTFLFMAQKAGLGGKAGGAFGSSTHSGDAPQIIFDTMENVFGMKMVDLGGFALKEGVVDTPEGIHSCQDYAKAVCAKL